MPLSAPNRSDVELVEVNDRRDFIALADEWNALVAAANNQPFHRHEFIRLWLEHFAPSARLRIITLRDDAGRLVAALPLIEQRTLMYGCPVRQLVSTANDHSYRFDLIAEDAPRAGRKIFDYLARDGGWDVLRINDVEEGGAATHLYEAARGARFPSGRWASHRSPFIPLRDSFDALMQPISTKFKANLRRRRKRLAEHGHVRCRRVADGADMEEALARGFALEQDGWKGVEGTAIAQDPRTRSFYADLAHAAAAHGYLSLYALELNGRMIAFQYGLTYGRVYSLLKVGYDESLKACSPGHLLVEDVLGDIVQRGVREFDFLGPDMAWKRDWTDKVRPHDWLFVFRRNPLGWALATAKFTVLPAAKRTLARWRRA